MGFGEGIAEKERGKIYSSVPRAFGKSGLNSTLAQ